MLNEHAQAGLAPFQLQRLIDELGEGVIVLDAGGAIVAANRSALDMHGCIKVSELGRDAAQYAQHFQLREPGGRVLPAARMPLARLQAGESFRAWELELAHVSTARASRLLEFGELVLNDQNGRPQHLLLFLRNNADKVDADALFDRFFASKPAPAAILRLDDSRYLKANDEFCNMTGFSRDEVVGRPLHEIDVFHEASDREGALRALASHAAIRPQESRVRTSDGGSKAVMVAGQPLVIAGSLCMLLSFVDLETQKRAELALRQSEERFAKAFRMAPVPMLVCVQSNWCVIEANGAYLNAVGRSRGEIIGYPVMNVGLHMSHKALREIGVALESSQMILNHDVELHRPDGVMLEAALSAESVVIHDEVCALLVIQDVSERKRTEAELMSAIEAVMKDASWFSRTIMEKLAHVRRPQGTGQDSDSLTPREREVLELICNGNSDAEIAEALTLSRNTVRNHVGTLYGKIGVNRRSAAVVWGRERGFGAQ